jgi:Bacteriophage lambda head decoration protein D
MEYNFLAGGPNTEIFAPPFLFAGSAEVATKPAVLASGQGTVVLGQVLGMVTATGKLAKHNPGATDGSQVAVGIAAFPVDATAADANLSIYIAGEFALDALVYHATTDTVAERLACFPVSSRIVVKQRNFSA